MNDKDLTGILGRCLEEIAAGETAAACLARYPEHAVELAPLLAMAGELGTLGQYRVSDAARVRAKAQLRRAASPQCDQRSTPKGWLRPGSFLMPRVAAGLAFTLICVLLMAGIVAASGPGDLAYGLRIAAEQIPARLAPGAEARARAELRIASHRLAELDWTMGSQDQALDERTVSALVADVEMAAETAASLPEPERIAIAARIAESARSTPHAEALQLASVRAYRAAERVWAGPVSPAQPSPGLLREPTITPTAAPHGTSAPERTPSPNAPATATSLPTPTSAPSDTRNRATPHDAGDQQATPQGRPSATAGRSTPEATPSGRGPTATAPRPGLTATSPSPGPTATSPGSRPVATPPGPGPAATSPGPRPESPPGGPRGSRG
jgi:hypothetical protein